MEASDAHVEQPLGDMVSAIEHAMQPVHDEEEFQGGGGEDEFGTCRMFPMPFGDSTGLVPPCPHDASISCRLS